MKSYRRSIGIYANERICNMKIKCVPRKWFERIKGTVLEEQVLAQNKVVSIQVRGRVVEEIFTEYIENGDSL